MAIGVPRVLLQGEIDEVVGIQVADVGVTVPSTFSYTVTYLGGAIETKVIDVTVHDVGSPSSLGIFGGACDDILGGGISNDAIFGGFADARLGGLSDHQLDRFETLLAANDSDLYNWISGLKAPPENRKTDVFQMILDFKYHL